MALILISLVAAKAIAVWNDAVVAGWKPWRAANSSIPCQRKRVPASTRDLDRGRNAATGQSSLTGGAQPDHPLGIRLQSPGQRALHGISLVSRILPKRAQMMVRPMRSRPMVPGSGV